MNRKTIEYLSVIGSISSIIGILITIIRATRWYWIVICIESLIIFLLVFYFNKKKFIPSNRRKPSELNIALNEIKSTFYEQDIITDFLKNTILNENIYYEVKNSIKYFELLNYEKSFIIKGNDVYTKEILIGKNNSNNSQDKIRFIEYGGAILNDAYYQKKAVQIKGKEKYELNESIYKANERIKISDFIFASPIKSNTKFKIEYNDFWPGAMVDGEDALFYTQTLYFTENINQITSKIEFDKPIKNIRPYYYDFNEKKCQICPLPKKLSETKYYWEISNPKNNRLYYIVFVR